MKTNYGKIVPEQENSSKKKRKYNIYKQKETEANDELKEYLSTNIVPERDSQEQVREVFTERESP